MCVCVCFCGGGGGLWLCSITKGLCQYLPRANHLFYLKWREEESTVRIWGERVKFGTEQVTNLSQRHCGSLLRQPVYDTVLNTASHYVEPSSKAWNSRHSKLQQQENSPCYIYFCYIVMWILYGHCYEYQLWFLSLLRVNQFWGFLLVEVVGGGLILWTPQSWFPVSINPLSDLPPANAC